MAISEDEWGNNCKLQWKTTASHSWREFGWKSITRFFITPAQKRQIVYYSFFVISYVQIFPNIIIYFGIAQNVRPTLTILI